MTSSRPVLVTVVGVLNIVLGALVLLTAIAMFYVGTQNFHDMGLDAKAIEDIEKLIRDTNMSWQTLCNVAGILVLIPAIIDIAIGIGLLRGWRIMWYLGVFFNALGAVAAIIVIIGSAATGSVGGALSNVLGLAINAVILWYLMQPKVKDWFNI